MPTPADAVTSGQRSNVVPLPTAPAPADRTVEPAASIQPVEPYAASLPQLTEPPAAAAHSPSGQREVKSAWANKLPAAPPSRSVDDRRNIHVYGGKAALTFEPTVARTGGEPTIVLDAAAATGTRQYDWANKLRIQISPDELPIVLAVLLGWLPRCEFIGHGEQNEKGFSLENQPGKGTVFVRIFAKDQGIRAVPMAAGTACRVAGLVLMQFQAGFPGLTATETLNLVKNTAVRLSLPSNPK